MNSLQNIFRESLLVAIVYCAICFLFHVYVLSKVLFPVIPGYKHMSPEIKFQFCNRFTAATHAALLFVRTVIYWVYINPSMEIKETGGPFEARGVDLMIGYLFYDIVLEIWLWLGLKWVGCKQTNKEVLAHHLVGLVTQGSARLSNSGAAAFYCMMVYIAEGSTPFLHCAWLLQTLSMKDSKMFLVAGGALLLTFFVFRVMLSPYFSYHLLYYKSAWGPNSDVMFWFQFSCSIFFWVINYFWFYRIFNIFMKKAPRPGS